MGITISLVWVGFAVHFALFCLFVLYSTLSKDGNMNSPTKREAVTKKSLSRLQRGKAFFCYGCKFLIIVPFVRLFSFHRGS